MKKRNNKHEKRVKRMIVACGLCAIILTASTYAWFVGMKTVNVSAFDVSIAAIDSLSLSLNGSAWADTVAINETNYSSTYVGNTNSWGGEGLIPMSSVGLIDSVASRMILYEKGSFTVTDGGYRVMATRVHNETSDLKEADGYVAFDLFVKNLSGNEYYDGNADPKNEEAIYLTPESIVKVAQAGGEQNTGIENSVRVAFAQIGRIKATINEPNTITGINCTQTGTVTSICSRTAQIWEPNDTKHVANAINWYKKSCKTRTGSAATSFTYSNEAVNGDFYCKKIVDNKYYQTYAISGRIDADDYVDVYDGGDYNNFEKTLATYNPLTNSLDDVRTAAGDGKLLAFNTFTDTEKNLEGVDRPQLLTLAPNSITKVRIYIWIEGQDVDNYDFASLGKKISVAFGFTKERLYGEDIDYNKTTPTGPALSENVNSRPAVPTTAVIEDDGRVTSSAA